MTMSLMMRQTTPSMTHAGKKVLPVQTASPQVPVPIRRISALSEGAHVRKRGLCLGTDPDGEMIYLKPKHLRTHLHIIEQTGRGKRRWILWFFLHLFNTMLPVL